MSNDLPAVPADAILSRLPPDYPDDLLPDIRAAVAASGRKVVALDDDPTGVQTVSDVAVLVDPDADLLGAELRDERALCFVLTNSRALPAPDAERLNRRLGAAIAAASAATGRPVAVASRSDSTLRGHFPIETDALAAALAATDGMIDGVLIVPAFVEGGRLTVDDIHYVRDGDRLVPAAETEFARDATFGYRSSNLRDWVVEKTGGRVDRGAVAAVGIADVREGGSERVAAILAGARGGQPVVLNAATDRDLEVLALGTLWAEAAGQRFLYRTAASFLRARAGIARRPLLTRAELVGTGAPAAMTGLVVVGSHVRKTTEQVAALLRMPGLAPIELGVADVLDPARRDDAIAAAAAAVDRALANGETPVLTTSRRLELGSGADDQLRISQSVSAALVAVVRAVSRRPGWIVAKGGITSSDVGTEALAARRALVLGQVAAGVPVWRLGPETRFPGLAYVVFPGNVGGSETLADVVDLLRGDTA